MAYDWHRFEEETEAPLENFADLMEEFDDMKYDFGVCHEYYETTSCVSGHNMEQLHDVTLQ